MGTFITPLDLQAFTPDIDPAKAGAMIEDAEAMAALVAPCLSGELTDGQRGAVRAILRGAVLRWHEAGSGALQQQTAGPFGVTMDTRQQRRGMFWPSEIEQLQQVCAGATTRGAAFSVQPYAGTSRHLPWCDLYFGGASCSCGVDIAGYPIYETDGL